MTFVNKYRFRVPTLILAAIFGFKGVEVLTLPQEYIHLVMGIGFPLGLAKIGLIIVGCLDIGVAIYTLGSLSGRYRPHVLALLWLALWPVVPAVMERYIGEAFEREFLIGCALAGALYYYHYIRRQA